MFRNFFLIISLTLIGYVSVQAKMFGLFYGVDGYGLSSNENDITALADLYRKNNGSVILVRGDSVTHNVVIKYLKSQCDGCQKDDIFIFAYSGHGNNGIIQCGEEIIYYDEIKRIINKCKANRKVIIIDACRSGSFYDTKEKLVGNNIVVITSSRKSEDSYSTDNNSLLYNAVFNGLKGDADVNNNGKIEVKELFDYIKDDKRMKFLSQHPTIKGRFNDDMVLYTYEQKEDGQNLNNSSHDGIFASIGDDNINTNHSIKNNLLKIIGYVLLFLIGIKLIKWFLIRILVKIL